MAMYYKVWVASQRFHGGENLTYSYPKKLSPGQLISIPLQNKDVMGIVDSVTAKPAFATKAILQTWPVTLPGRSLDLLRWIISYYPVPIGVATELFTPPSLAKKHTLIDTATTKLGLSHLPELTPEQKTAYAQMVRSTQSVLLHGDTGTGKTRLYLELAIKTIRSGRSCIILTPEIGLTEQLLGAFKSVFGKQVLVTHSAMTSVQRRTVWYQAATPTVPWVVIGPRSAIFSPLPNIGLIVMDEAHDGAYKQEQAPYYQTSRVAAYLARLHSALFVMGTATPLITDYYTLTQKKLPIIRLSQQALPTKATISFQLIDHRDKALFSRSPWLSSPLLEAIDLALKNNEQSLLFLNRRGSARLVLCNRCGWQAMCPHCDVALTYHQDFHNMRCHSCNFNSPTPTTCPECGSPDLLFRSIGTKALETEIKRLYPSAHIARFDRDTPAAQSLSKQYGQLHAGSIDIIIGTQTIAKGFDLPRLSVAGIIQADSGLQIPDYTSNERTYQLISQVSGRVGRGHLPGRLFIQSFNPASPLITQALSRDYETFYKQELAERSLFRFPPFYFLLKVSCVRATPTSAQKACQQIAATIRRDHASVLVEGPTPRFIEKISGKYGWQLVIKSLRRPELLAIIRSLPGNCTYDIDPSDLL